MPIQLMRRFMRRLFRRLKNWLWHGAWLVAGLDDEQDAVIAPADHVPPGYHPSAGAGQGWRRIINRIRLYD